ncbi:probable cysteine--tRNA ligase, mitochondrial isoform X8 [Camelus ferus]|uniref:Probable cysteine--tRNA ligase, mitochondrial isoform X8 n=1 Tax=Camelus ferus TaxID=419612 RepID=A0A8B8UEJ5_CAMFR|nr:probable cysteine--tRNA ligase, mitochondrial isoform X8 [Camelus ferus]
MPADARGRLALLAPPGRTGPGAEAGARAGNGEGGVGGPRAGLAAARGLRHRRQGVQQPHPEEGPLDREQRGRRLLVFLWTNCLRSRTPWPRLMNVSPASLANLYEEDFKQDMAALKVLPPTVYLRVTDNIPQIIAFIEGVIARGHAYCTAKGNVYFDLQSRGDKYGRLVGVAPGPVGEPAVDSDKRHPSDFALWKAVKPQEPAWASPWGNGRPGWHIECSTICRAAASQPGPVVLQVLRGQSCTGWCRLGPDSCSVRFCGTRGFSGTGHVAGEQKCHRPRCVTLDSVTLLFILVFGSHLDIHSGGIDLAFPHHENEIAQCEAFHQCRQWGNYFLHAGLPPGRLPRRLPALLPAERLQVSRGLRRRRPARGPAPAPRRGRLRGGRSCLHAGPAGRRPGPGGCAVGEPGPHQGGCAGGLSR